MSDTTAPKIGTIVNYRLGEQDATEINRRRPTYSAASRRENDGAQIHVGNTVSAGDVYPAMVVRTWSLETSDTVQLQVFLDGNDTYWATSRQRETEDFDEARYFET